LPEGTVADEGGNPTTDPHQASSLLAAGSYKVPPERLEHRGRPRDCSTCG
jgi:LDH2 family malate/lactate/ureidoglycolate dehydrogenase